MKITYKETDKLAPLFSQYPMQSQPQRAFIEVHWEERTITADWSGEVGNGLPAYVWEGKADRYSVPAAVNEAELISAMNKIAEMIGDSERSEDLDYTLMRYCQDHVVECDYVYETQDWYEYDKPEIGAGATDEQLKTLAKKVVEDARQEGYLLTDDPIDYLTEYREELREEVLQI